MLKKFACIKILPLFRSSASNYGNTSQLKKLEFINLLKKVLQKSVSLKWFHNTVLESDGGIVY